EPEAEGVVELRHRRADLVGGQQELDAVEAEDLHGCSPPPRLTPPRSLYSRSATRQRFHRDNRHLREDPGEHASNPEAPARRGSEPGPAPEHVGSASTFPHGDFINPGCPGWSTRSPPPYGRPRQDPDHDLTRFPPRSSRFLLCRGAPPAAPALA